MRTEQSRGAGAGRGRVRAVACGLAAVLAAGLMAGCGSDDGDPPAKPSASRLPGSSAPSSPEAEPSAEPTPAPTSEGTDGDAGAAVRELARAGATARAEVDGSTVISVERDDGQWEVELADSAGDEYDVVVSADGSEVTTGPRKDAQDATDRDKNLRRIADAELDFVAGAEAAVAEVPDAEVDEVGLDSHRSSSGPTVWEVNLRSAGQEHEVVVDAADGSILDHEVDD